MPTTDPRVDAYIESAARFAQPILRALRDAVHAACPSAVETIKWGMPFFVVDGRILAHMAAFKQHGAFGFWRGRDRALVVGATRDDAMGQFGRLQTLADLPARRELLGLIRRAAALSASPEAPAESAPATRHRKAARPPLPVPDVLVAALRGSDRARATFDKLAASHRRDYIEWIVEAKREATRDRRVAQAVQWLAEGKTRNWKYEAC